jgi:hypothetical protein
MATNNAINQHKPFPLFFAYLNASTGSVTGDGTNVFVPFNTTSFNNLTCYNTATYKFTVPTTGTYLLNVNLIASNVNAKTGSGVIVFVNGATYNNQNLLPGSVTVSTNFCWMYTTLAYLTAAQEVEIILNISGGAKNCAILSGGAADPKSWFSATLIG